MSAQARMAAVSLLCLIQNASFSNPAEPTRPVTVEDCVRVRRIFDGQVAVSPDGQEVAYVLKSPDLTRNRNVYGLYSRNLIQKEHTDNGLLLLELETPIRGLRWISNGPRLVVQTILNAKQVIVEVDSVARNYAVLLASENAISSFSMDRSGDVLVYSTIPKAVETERNPSYAAFGYPVSLGKGISPPADLESLEKPAIQVFLAKRQPGGEFSSVPMSRGVASLQGVKSLSLSPDGRYLTFSYKNKDMPESWQKNPYYRWRQSFGSAPETLGLYEFAKDKVRIGFDAPGAGWGQPAVWAEDSQAFAVNAMSPPGSYWEERDIREDPIRDEENWSYSHTHTFSVDVSTGAISEVARVPALWHQNQVLYWKAVSGRILLREDDKNFVWLEAALPEWKKISELTLPNGVNLHASEIIGRSHPNVTSDGIRIVGVRETATAPPDLYILDLNGTEMRLLTDLNPQLRDIFLQPVEKMDWQDQFGFHCSGQLIKPAGYVSGNRYPTIIMGKTWWENYFIADTQYQTAFAPQVLASAGFLVLLANERPTEFVKDKTRKYPGIDEHEIGDAGEFVQFSNVVESAIRKLDGLGLSDTKNVGLVGFSTTSWKTDMLLSHTNFQFRAASSADSGLWNYGMYWLSNSANVMTSSEKYMAGPPYSKTLKNWLKYSPAFNASHVETPLLMEYMGRGASAPTIDGMEFFVALRKLNKAVELYYYPNGEHILDNPSERVGSLQRNVDWFRFWMMGVEGVEPAYDPNQFVRWRKLRETLKQDSHRDQNGEKH